MAVAVEGHAVGVCVEDGFPGGGGEGEGEAEEGFEGGGGGRGGGGVGEEGDGEVGGEGYVEVGEGVGDPVEVFVERVGVRVGVV